MSTQTADKKSSSFSQIIKSDPDLISFIKSGDLLEVGFLKREAGAVYFDAGKFGTGIIFGAELSNARDIIKNLNKGDKASAKVVVAENGDGFIELSLAGAHKQKGWQSLKDLAENNEVIEIKIIGANSGGLVAEINEIKAFLPVSQLSNEHYPRVEMSEKSKILTELKKFVGQDLRVRIIDLNPRTNKLIISERAASEEDIKKLLEAYKIGDVVDGIVSGVTNFGAFIKFADNPSIEGLIHLSEIEHRIIEHPKEILKVDDMIKAKIIEIKDAQVFLSLKAIKTDPWDSIQEKLKEKQEIKGVVYKFYPFGALISLEGNFQGLVNIMEFGGAEEMKNVLEIGKEYDFIIDSIKPQEKRILLKFKKS